MALKKANTKTTVKKPAVKKPATKKIAAKKVTVKAAVKEAAPLSNIQVLGEYIPQKEVDERLQLVQVFTRDQMKASRRIMDMLAALTIFDVDNRVMYALQDGSNVRQRAKASWEVLGWHQLLNPFEHSARQHFIKTQPLKDWVYKDAGSLFMYGVFVLREPNTMVADKLKNLHPATHKQYVEHCRMLAVAATQMQSQFAEAARNTS